MLIFTTVLLLLSTTYFYFRSEFYLIQVDNIIDAAAMVHDISYQDANRLKRRLKRHPFL